MEDQNKDSEGQYYRPSPDNGKGVHPFGQVLLSGCLTVCYIILALLMGFAVVSSISSGDQNQYITPIYTVIIGLPIVVAILLFVKKKAWLALGMILALVLPFLVFLACLGISIR